MNKILRVAFAVTCIAGSMASSAAPITWQFTGTVSNGNHGSFFFPFVFTAGEPVTIDFSFEPNTPCTFCSATSNGYQNPLTALSFASNGSVFDFPLVSSTLELSKDQPPGPGGTFFLNVFDLFFQGFDPNSNVTFQGGLFLQNPAAMPPVPGINDARLSNLLPPDPAVFDNSFPLVDNNFFDVTAAQDRGLDEFGGQTLTSSVVATAEPATISLLIASFLLMLLGSRGLSQRAPRPSS